MTARRTTTSGQSRSGVVTQFKFVNPHALLSLEVTDTLNFIGNESTSLATFRRYCTPPAPQPGEFSMLQRTDADPVNES
jgi:hypothetical protein